MLAEPSNIEYAFQSLGERVDWAKCFKYSPDTYRLRYAGPQRVFLWGDMQLASVFNPQLERFGIKPSENFYTQTALAETKIRFVQMKNISEERNKYFMLEEVLCFDNTLVKSKLGDDKPEALPLRGRVIECDLKTILALDRYFSNCDKVKRMPITVVNTSEEEYRAWCYINKAHLLFTNSSNNDELFSKGVFLRKYPVTRRGDKKFYGTWGGH